MNQLSVILLVAILAVEANANLFGSSDKGKVRFFDLKHSASDSDFEGLNKYLTKKVPSDESQSNLARIEADVGQLSGPIKEAALRVLKLAKSDQCDEQLLSTLDQIDGAHLKLGGLKRLEKVIRPHLSRALGACTSYIEQHLEARFFGSPLAVTLTNIAKAASAAMQDRSVSPAKKSLARRLFQPAESKYKYYPIDEHVLSDILEILASEDPSAKFSEQVGDELTGKTKTVKYRHNFDEAFNKYLVLPCQDMASTLGGLLDAAGHVANIQTSDTDDLYSFVDRRSVMFQGLAWMYKDCQAVLKMKGSKKATMFKELTS